MTKELATKHAGRLRPLGWRPIGRDTDTAVVYIHGFNVTLEQVCSVGLDIVAAGP